MIGKTVAHYRIVSKLGAGGMGVVYKAEDTSLKRFVALKFLSEDLARDSRALERFRREAQAASALNHPNICTIYAFEEEDGRHFIAMELVEGQTLKDHLAGRSVPLDHILDLIVQTADGLETAHSRGVLHRDIKPSNIFVTPEGQVRIVDFGLAKQNVLAAASGSSGDSRSAEETLTSHGSFLGTVGYMSPEQVRGEDLDPRSDVFSLGVVLYEAVAGRRPFVAPTAAAVFGDILYSHPQPVSRFNPAVPPELERIITRALEKDRELRYQTAADLRAEIKRLRRDLQSGAPVAPAAPAVRARGIPWLAMVSVAAAGLVVAALVATRGAPITGFETPPEAPQVVPFTTFRFRETGPAFSPDGRQIAFAWDGEVEGNQDIYVKIIGTGIPLRLSSHPANELKPAWSPDGREVAFVRILAPGSAEIISVPALGGPERKMTDTQAARPDGISWSPDGRHLALADRLSQSRDAIFLLDVQTGQKRRVSEPPEGSTDTQPVFSPDGSMLAFARGFDYGASGVFVMPSSGGSPRQLTTAPRIVAGLDWTADGKEVVFSSNRAGTQNIWRVSVSGGRPRRVTTGGEFAYQPAVARQGGKLAYTSVVADDNVWRFDANTPEQPGIPLIASTRIDHSPNYSPDGKRIAFVSERSGSTEIWVSDGDGRNALQQTSFGGAFTGSPRWSPDGQWIAFDSRPSGRSEIFVVSSNGGSPRQLTDSASAGVHSVVPGWSADGRFVYFATPRTGSMQIWKVPLAGGEAVQVTHNGGLEAFETPDGQYLYFTKSSATPGFWRMPASGGPEEAIREISPEGIAPRAWAVANNGIYFATAREPLSIRFFNFATRQIREVARPQKRYVIGVRSLDASPDGRWVLYSQIDQRTSDIMLVENFR